MTDRFNDENDWGDTPAAEDWHDHEFVKDDFDIEITEVHSSDWLNVRDLELEHTEFSHSHIHSEPTSELVKQHFPHLAPPPVVEEPLPILLWFVSCAVTAALAIAGYELLRYYVRARETAKSAKKKKSKEKELKDITSSGPLPLIDSLRMLCKVSHDIQNSNRVPLNQSIQPPLIKITYAEDHCKELSRLAYSLYEHVNKHFNQFEAVSSDPSWLQLEMEQEAEQDRVHHSTNSRNTTSYSGGAVDVIAEVQARIDSIIAALSPSNNITSFTSHHTGKASRKVHIEDRLTALYTQWGLSDVKVQFSLIRDALLRVQCVSKKGYIYDIVTRLRRAIENRNEYHLLECTVLLQELDLHHSAAYSEIHDVYCTAEGMLSELHEQEDRNVRRVGQEKFRTDQNEMIDTFQAFSPREPSGSSKKQVFLTDSAKNHPINTPIVPQTRESDIDRKTKNDGCGIADENGLNDDMNNLHISDHAVNYTASATGTDVPSAPPAPADPTFAIDTSGPTLSLDSSCLSPPQSYKYPHSVTSPFSNNNNTSINNENNCLDTEESIKITTLSTVGTPLSPVSDTHKLISSHWAMEALRMRREAQNSVDLQLRKLKEKRKDKEQQARARARRSIEEREQEVRTAKLFLEGLDEQRKSRQVAETEHFLRQEKELQQEFATQKVKQITWDRRAYQLLCVVYVLVYLLTYTEYNMYSGGILGLYSWVLGTLRNSCHFLACDKRVIVVRSELTHSTNINTIAGGINSNNNINPVEPSFLPTDAPYLDYTASDTCSTDYAGKQPSLKLVTAYQSTYRTTTQYLNSLVTVPVSAYVLQYALSGYTGRASHPVTLPSTTGSGVLYEMYNGGRCVLHVLFRTLPSILLTRVTAFLGMKKLSGWVAVLFTLLCFSDILVQMAVGPLLPLLVILSMHTVLFHVLTVFDEHRLRWMLVFNKNNSGINVRNMILYVIYPIVGLCAVVLSTLSPELKS